MLDRLRPMLAVCKYSLPNSVVEKFSSLATSNWLAPLETEISRQIDPLFAFFFIGNEKHTGVNLKSLVVSSKSMSHYIVNLLYAEKPQVKESGKVSPRNPFLKHDFLLNEVDMILIVTNRLTFPFLPDDFIIIPKQVRFICDLSDPPEILFQNLNRRRRRSIQTIEKIGYSYEVVHEMSKFELFYNETYYPYIIKRHQELATPESFAYLKQLFKNGGLLLVKKNNEIVSGILFCVRGKTIWTPSMGVKLEKIKDEFVRKTAGDALIYFLIKWARKHGYKCLDYGNSRPFLNDGVVRYKKEWGMRVQKSGENAIFVHLNNFGIGVRSFLTNNPFFYLDGNQLKGCVFIDRKQPVSEGELNHFFRLYFIPGLPSLTIISTSGFEERILSKASINNKKQLNPSSLNHLLKVAKKAGKSLALAEIGRSKNGLKLEVSKG